ncbi:MAG: endonuclease III [Candidatus Aenigmarchaeota archaeon]|nr:endonuclease III [Candidatus Aenigmarchaeota archaeon]
MRKKIDALVNFLEKRYGYPKFSRNQFKLLITTVLSQRTRDENTKIASDELFSVVNGPEDILNLSTKKLESLIKSSGMYRQKAKRIKEISKIILEKYKGKVPNNREELISLPGVGYKTADIVLSYGFNIPTIAVDTHVNRIPKRIGIVDKDASVEEVRETLEKHIKGKKRFLVNLGLVRFGQEICRPISPKCSLCPIKNICDFYKRK